MGCTVIPPPYGDFNPRSPCGERHPPRGALCFVPEFQSTLPVWGATKEQALGTIEGVFQSTLPVWGATGYPQHTGRPPRDFNPRSPCGERRCRAGPWRLPVFYFNPRSPCGERPPPPGTTGHGQLFQSTLPVWGATPGQGPGAGGPGDFNPRSPCGERRWRYTDSFPAG